MTDAEIPSVFRRSAYQTAALGHRKRIFLAMSAVIEQPRVVTPDKVRRLEAVLRQMPNQYTEEQLTSHHFCNGVYARQFNLPAGGVAVGKTHAKESFFLLVQGDVTLTTADGTVVRVVAPFMCVTQPGSKRVVAAHADAIFLTFHPNPENERDLKALEDIFIIPEALPAPEAKELLE
jgi:hypothetical protein